MRQVVIRWSNNGLVELAGVPAGCEAGRVVERLQRERAEIGWPTACTWQVVDGDVVSGLIAAGRVA